MGEFFNKSESYSESRAFATANGINLEQKYGLGLTAYSIGTPAPQIKLIDVPGRPGQLDASLALNGKVNYTNRTVTADFHVRNVSYAKFDTLYATLLAQFNGSETKLCFSTDPGYYYKGRFTLSYSKDNPVNATVTFSCSNAFPYKLEEAKVEKAISSSAYVTCVGKKYNGTVTINTSTAMSVTFKGTTYQLVAGNNVIREIHLAEGNNSLRFVGTGNVVVTYERGVL